MILSKFQKSAVKKFNQRIYDGLVSYETKSCLCNSNYFDKIYEHDRCGLWHPVVICRDCGLIQSNPQLSDAEYKRFYSTDEYRLLHKGENYLEILRSKYNENNPIFDILSPIMKELNLNTILEFGCSGGWNLLPFYKDGYEVTGYDYSYNLVKLGISYGLNLREGSIATLNATNDKYDVIIMNHVIEHLTNFFDNMKLILQHLNTDGILFAAVPNIDNFRKGQFQNAHIYYFSPRTFNYYMTMCGLEMIKSGSTQEGEIGDIGGVYGIFRLTTQGLIVMNHLESEYSFMKRKIAIGKFKSIIVSFLEKIWMEKPVKSLIAFLKN